jgi:hypothetical protein
MVTSVNTPHLAYSSIHIAMNSLETQEFSIAMTAIFYSYSLNCDLGDVSGGEGRESWPLYCFLELMISTTGGRIH